MKKEINIHVEVQYLGNIGIFHLILTTAETKHSKIIIRVVRDRRININDVRDRRIVYMDIHCLKGKDKQEAGL